MKKTARIAGVAALLLCAAACSGTPDVDTFTIGQKVAVTKADGELVEGTVVSRDGRSLQVTTAQATKSVPRDQIVDARSVDATRPTTLPSAATFREYTVPAGTRLSLTLSTGISSTRSQVEDPVQATLARLVTVGGAEVLPAGSTLRGTVAGVEESGRVKGRASIALRFTSVTIVGRAEPSDIDATYSQTARATKGEDAAKIGVGAGAGAIIGALFGGKSGAGAGALVGGGAGTALVLSTKGEETSLPAGAALTVTLRRDAVVRVPVR